jgi:hypothetical protein
MHFLQLQVAGVAEPDASLSRLALMLYKTIIA